MRTVALFLLLTLLLSCPALADTGYDILYEDAMANADAFGKPQILYTGRANISMRMRSKPDVNSEAVGMLKEREWINIFGFDQYWLFCWDEEVGAYYVGRHNVVEITPVSADVPSYGVTPNAYIAVTSQEAVLYAEPNTSAAVIDTYPKDTRLSFWLIEDGWAVVPYKREVGYLYAGNLTELSPVSPSVDYAQEGDVIAAFTTFYSLKKTELNIGRMQNIQVGCDYISKTYQPGEEFDFNATAGPYRQSRGYLPSPVLIDGGTVPGYGGGTCQVSTTLYNALLQLPEGMTIVYRRPHGPGGASYAAHGVDAAVGNSELNLRFRNDYPFPVTLDCTAQNGALCVCIRKGVYTPPEEKPVLAGEQTPAPAA